MTDDPTDNAPASTDAATPAATDRSVASTASESTEPAGAHAAARSRSMVALLPGVALLILVADLITKIVVVATIDPLRPISIIGDTVTLRLVRNSGAAFSMATGYTWVLTIVALAVVIGIIRYSSRLRSPLWALGLGLILGGALGNLVDRLFRDPGPLRGHVVDFVSIGWWPVFNVADSAVVCGAVLLVALTLFGVELDGTRASSRRERSQPSAAHDA